MTKIIRLILILAILIITQLPLFSQNCLDVVVKDSTTNEYLAGVIVSVSGTNIGAITNSIGLAKLNNIPSGLQSIGLSFLGYRKEEMHFLFPLSNISMPIMVSLSAEAEQMEEVTVTATRNNSRIEDLPTKIEVLGLDDMEEENSIRPANITSLLGDIAGIQMQQTSASSGNLNARIQGLNGRYSQILKDGMPLYGGFSGSFSILQIPPLDLRQIEIIKGSASTLFGGDAIGGIINLVSKNPTLKPETNFLINQTSLKETDINSYISRKYSKLGFTFFGGHVFQKPVDVNKDGFSDMPDIKNIVIHPKLFYYLDEKTTLSLGINTTLENRKGGDMEVIDHEKTPQHSYLIEHKLLRSLVELVFEKKANNGSLVLFKGSTSMLDRSIKTPQYIFSALQTLYFSELSYFFKKEKYDYVFGVNFTGDSFHKKQADSIQIGSYNFSTIGFFIQNDWHVTEKLLLESGLRLDYHNTKGQFLLPRLSIMYKFAPEFTSRLNGGLGYKIPTIFSYIDEEIDLNRIISNQTELKTETSQGINFDVNYNRQLANKISLTLNQSFFYTLLNQPIVYYVNNRNQVTLSNADKPIETKGLQTYVRLAYGEFELYLSYVYTHAIKKYDVNNPWFLATPEHNLSGTLTYAPSANWRFGLENMLIGPQVIENKEKTPTYDFMAAMIERKFKKVSIVLNGENIFDFRQKNFLIPPITNPSFKTIWAPIDGRVINISVNIKL
jgi:outer membrane receptor for ferrienterochelin and colicins